MLQLDRGEGQDYLDETGGCGVTVTRLDSWVAGEARDLGNLVMLWQVRDRVYLVGRDCSLLGGQLGAGRQGEGGAGAGRRARAWQAGQRVAD